MVWMHRRAPMAMSLMLAAIGGAIGAAAQSVPVTAATHEPVTQREFYSILAVGFVFVLVGTAGVMKLLFGLVVSDYRAIASRMELAVARFEDRQFGHNGDASAHPSVFKPVNDKIEKLEHDLVEAVAECLGHRAKRRSTDPQTGGPNDSGPDFTDASERAVRRAEERKR